MSEHLWTFIGEGKVRSGSPALMDTYAGGGELVSAGKKLPAGHCAGCFT